MTGFGRRAFLAAAGLGVAGLAGCARAEAAGAAPVTTATYIPKSYDDLYPGIQTFMDTLAARSGGRMQSDMFDSGALLGAEQLLPGLLLGVADVMFQTSSYVSSSYPILGALELPFGAEDYAKQRRAADPDGPLYALINEQLAAQNARLLGGMPCTFEYLWTVNRPIREPADARGLRIRVAGEIEGETVKALGGAPVFMGSSEVFEALERGTIDGLMSYLGTVVSRDLQEIIRYGTKAHVGAYTVDAYCRADWYEAQPPELRAALDEAGRALYQEGTEVMVGVHEGDYLKAVLDGGVELVEPTGAELEAFRAAVRPVYGRWEHLIGDQAVSERAVALIDEA
ncbi:TRAP transporter substrate-binding protein [Pseudonocardia zijingensis]|uniref:TRAP-type C4-dicarboxylate transport system substrate-binding protein n=1 Tax=Pseudonocardia zijingensis TaxID=153376 RepID=A0ABN1NFS0_9PSEU